MGALGKPEADHEHKDSREAVSVCSTPALSLIVRAACGTDEYKHPGDGLRIDALGEQEAALTAEPVDVALDAAKAGEKWRGWVV